MAIPGDVIYCDDIRQEVGNKFTLVGCYMGDMIVGAQAPVTLPKLCLRVSLAIPLGELPEQVKLQVLLDPGDRVLFENAIPLTRPSLASAIEGTEAELRIAQDVAISPLVLSETGALKVRVHADAREVKLPALTIRFAPGNPS